MIVQTDVWGCGVWNVISDVSIWIMDRSVLLFFLAKPMLRWEMQLCKHTLDIAITKMSRTCIAYSSTLSFLLCYLIEFSCSKIANIQVHILRAHLWNSVSFTLKYFHRQKNGLKMVAERYNKTPNRLIIIHCNRYWFWNYVSAKHKKLKLILAFNFKLLHIKLGITCKNRKVIVFLT